MEQSNLVSDAYLGAIIFHLEKVNVRLMVFSIKVCLSLHKVLSLQKTNTWFKKM